MRTLTLILSVFLVLSTACRKKEAIISGRLLTGCNGTPVAGVTISLRTGPSSSPAGILDATTVTDANGYFSLGYETRWNKSMELTVEGYGTITDIPPKESIRLGDIYQSGATRSVIKVKVNNPYATLNDEAIFYYEAGLEKYTIATPLHDTIFPEQHVQVYQNRSYRQFKERTERHGVNWYFQANYTGAGNWIQQDIPLCNGIPDTMLITID